jgi:hypothetical protein
LTTQGESGLRLRQIGSWNVEEYLFTIIASHFSLETRGNAERHALLCDRALYIALTRRKLLHQKPRSNQAAWRRRFHNQHVAGAALSRHGAKR